MMPKHAPFVDCSLGFGVTLSSKTLGVSFFPPGASYQIRFTVIRFENEHILITTPSAVYCKLTQFSSLCQLRAFR